MKRQIISVTAKLLLGTLFFAGAIAAQAQSQAQSIDPNHPISEIPLPTNNEPGSNETNVSVKYLGAREDLVSFAVSYKNPEGRKFSVIVLDQDNTQLFQRVFTDKNFEKKFNFPKTDKSKLTFVIRNFKDADISQSFAINVNAHYVEEIAIHKVN